MAAATSPGTAEKLMGKVLDVPWEDVATRTDMKDQIADLRGEMRIGFAQMDAKMERQLRIQLVWLVGTMLTLGSLIIALH